jgi:DNA-directed RNA polymerase subunit RPC12/RpoP
MKFKCGWCKSENKIKGMVSSVKIPIVCSECGTKIGYINYKDLNELIGNLIYWKNKYYKELDYWKTKYNDSTHNNL